MLRSRELDEMVAQDALVFAERAVELLRQEHAERLADVAGLDGMIATLWTSLTGSREAAIEAAVAAVRESGLRLRAAEVQLEEARAGRTKVDAVHAAAAVAESAEAERRARHLRALADRWDEVGERVRARQLERELLAQRLSVVETAAHAGSSLLAVLNTVVRGSEAEEERQQQLDYRRHSSLLGYEVAALAMSKPSSRHLVTRAIEDLPQRSEAFRAAMDELGRVYRAPDETQASNPLSAFLELHLLGSIVVRHDAASLAFEYADYAADVRSHLIPIDVEARELRQRLAELDAELVVISEVHSSG